MRIRSNEAKLRERKGIEKKILDDFCVPLSSLSSLSRVDYTLSGGENGSRLERQKRPYLPTMAKRSGRDELDETGGRSRLSTLKAKSLGGER